MSRIDAAIIRDTPSAQQRLRQDVQPTARRGRMFASLTVALLCLAGLVGGLFIVAIKDALFVLPGGVRLALLALLALGSLVVFGVFTLRRCRDQQFDRVAGQQIDRVAQAKQQPVTVGLSLAELIDDDSLARLLLQRAEQRASAIVHSVKPAQAYPIQQLKGPLTWLGLAAGCWLLLALVLPGQVLAVFSRVAMPWTDSPPFTLTQLEPRWTPMPQMVGDDVTLTVEPAGRMPRAVDWVVLNEAGQEAERFAMNSDGRGGFSYRLKRVDTPIDFRLEAFGRHTKTYTINPTPRPSVTQPDEAKSEEASTEPDGETRFDPDAVARRDLEAHRDWPSIKSDVDALLDELASAHTEAKNLDPADGDAIQALSNKLAELTERGEALANRLASMQGELPDDAAELLDALRAALTDMQTAALPAPPSALQAPIDDQPAPAQWLDQAAEATEHDREQIGLGLGPSDLSTESGSASGQPGEGPDIRDPGATGTYSETVSGGDEGPLPEAAMRQVPPSYRDHVSRYFERLAEERAKP